MTTQTATPTVDLLAPQIHALQVMRQEAAARVTQALALFSFCNQHLIPGTALEAHHVVVGLSEYVELLDLELSRYHVAGA